jgi:hypothetical protein
MSDTSTLSAYTLALPKPPPLTLGKFDADDFHDWMHTAQRFFVQYKLWDIVTGDSSNPAGDVEPSVTSGKIDLGENAGPVRTEGSSVELQTQTNLMKSAFTDGMSNTVSHTITSLMR